MNNDAIKILGSGEIGNGEYSQIIVQGNVRVKSDIKFQQLNVLGCIKSNSTLMGKELSVKGSIKGNAIINVDDFTCFISGNSSCQNILSDVVKIVPQKSILKKTSFFLCEAVKGNDVFVSDMCATLVTGKNVIVAGKSRIQELRYCEAYEIAESSVVKKIVKI